MTFGDSSAAVAKRRELIASQAERTTTHEAYDGSWYRVYPDLPPGVGWVVLRVGAPGVPKWYLATRDLAVKAINEHASQCALGRNANEHGNTPKAMRRLK